MLIFGISTFFYYLWKEAEMIEKAKSFPIPESSTKREDFIAKSELLRTVGRELTPYQFYEAIFGQEYEKRDYIYVLEEERTYRIAKGFEEISHLAMFRKDLYIPMASFFSRHYKMDKLEKLYALVVDIDEIRPGGLRMLINSKIAHHKIKPTLIMNSGSGVHLYYVFSIPVDCYHHRKIKLKELHTKIKQLFMIKSNMPVTYKLDKKVSLIQSYRLLGSLNKFGQQTMGIQYSIRTSAEDMCKWLKVDWHKSSRLKKAKEEEKTDMKKAKVERLIRPTASRRFYNHCFSRIGFETPIGNRYLALFALAVVAYKCRVTEEQLRIDMETLVEAFNEMASADPIYPNEIEKAVTGRSRKAILTPSQQLEEWFGFEFKRNKRNGRKRSEHLQMAREIKSVRTSGQTSKKVLKLIEQGLNKTQIAKELKMSRMNLYKTYGHLFEKPQTR